MGVVYRAYDTRRDRTVALERLPRDVADDEDFQARFRRESKLAARLDEPHIIPIHDFGGIDGRLYIDMRLVEGSDLSRLIAAEGGAPAPPLAVDIVGQGATALSVAHTTGLMHRDIKPSDVLVTGMIDQVRCSKLSGGPKVRFSVGRFSTASGTQAHLDGLEARSYDARWWTIGNERRGRLLTSPNWRGMPT